MIIQYHKFFSGSVFRLNTTVSSVNLCKNKIIIYFITMFSVLNSISWKKIYLIIYIYILKLIRDDDVKNKF
jgi:hypothetical protein